MSEGTEGKQEKKPLQDWIKNASIKRTFWLRSKYSSSNKDVNYMVESQYVEEWFDRFRLGSGTQVQTPTR